MVQYKLTYFNIRGMAECVRYMFAYADVPFEDCRLAHGEWAALKGKQPFGKLPVLEVDGKQIPQSVAICRYLGKKFGLAVEDPMKEALLEGVIDSIRDVQYKLSQEFVLKTPEAREEAAKAAADIYPMIEKVAAEGYLYGSAPTWVDVYFAGHMSSTLYYKPTFLDAYPNLKRLCASIEKKDSVKKYLAARPDEGTVTDRKAVVQ